MGPRLKPYISITVLLVMALAAVVHRVGLGGKKIRRIKTS